MRKPKNPKDKHYKGFCYCYSKHYECWKIYHFSHNSFMMMDFTSERLVKDWINKKLKKWKVRRSE